MTDNKYERAASNGRQSDNTYPNQYARRCLARWLELETWEPKEACCLMADINPDAAHIDWNSKIQQVRFGGCESVLVQNANLLTEDEFFILTAKERAPWGSDKNQRLIMINEKGNKLTDASTQLTRIWAIFNRATDFVPDAEHGSSPRSYIEWAKRKGLTISWLGWVEGQEPIKKANIEVKSNDPNRQSLKTRERNTLLIVIAALCKEIGIDPDQRGIAKKIEGMTEDFGAPVSYQTILSILKDLPDAVALRQKSN